MKEDMKRNQPISGALLVEHFDFIHTVYIQCVLSGQGLA